MRPDISISGRDIGPAYPPFVIAEISANHNGQIETAMRLIDEAKKAGADAVKIQTYKPDTITLDSDRDEFLIHARSSKETGLFFTIARAAFRPITSSQYLGANPNPGRTLRTASSVISSPSAISFTKYNDRRN